MPVFNLIIKEEAQHDIEETVSYYDSKPYPDLADRFLEEMEAALDKIVAHPFQYGFYQNAPLRARALETFRFIILYDIEDTTVIVYSVRHTSRQSYST